MLELFNAVSTVAWFRIFIVYTHVIISAFALTTVLKTDFKMLLSGVSTDEIESEGKNVFLLLAALWITGLTIIYIDTGFSSVVLMEKSKLLLKLICVLMLTANGLVLHFISFPILERDTVDVSYTEAVLLSVTGALSTSHWLLAAFVGMSASLSLVSFNALLQAYAVFLVVVVLSALCFVVGIRRVKIGIAGRRATDPPAARRKKMLNELIATPRNLSTGSEHSAEHGNRVSDKEIAQPKRSVFSRLLNNTDGDSVSR